MFSWKRRKDYAVRLDVVKSTERVDKLSGISSAAAIVLKFTRDIIKIACLTWRDWQILEHIGMDLPFAKLKMCNQVMLTPWNKCILQSYTHRFRRWMPCSYLFSV